VSTCATCDGDGVVSKRIGPFGSVIGDCHECSPPAEEVLRLRRVEAAARELLARLPRCGDYSIDDDDPHVCDGIATHSGVCDTLAGYACHGCRCKLCRPLPWADAARALGAALGREGRGGGT
jgi:hypothetical protein